MSKCCDKNPLQRSGINQGQRVLAGMQPGYISVDENNYADWIFFADEFSRYLRYYDTAGTASGDWKVFFSSDISAILGSIAVGDSELYRRFIKEKFDFIRNDDNAVNIVSIKEKLNELFSGIISLSKALDYYIKKLPDKDIDGEKEFVFKSSLINQIKTKLAPALKRLLAYYKAIDGDPAGSTDFLETSDMTGWKILNTSVESADVIISTTGLGKLWIGNAADWNAYYNSIAPDESIYGPAAWTDYRRINHAANHNLFS